MTHLQPMDAARQQTKTCQQCSLLHDILLLSSPVNFSTDSQTKAKMPQKMNASITVLAKNKSSLEIQTQLSSSVSVTVIWFMRPGQSNLFTSDTSSSSLTVLSLVRLNTVR